MNLRSRSLGPLKGTIRPPGDKSISHRALMLGALANGQTHLRGLLQAEDIGRTAHCLKEMGVPVWDSVPEVIIEGRGEGGLSAPHRVLEAGNSGTTLRLLMGATASYLISASFSGDDSLRKRPMDRVAIPLRQMGAEVEGQGPRCLPPVTVRGGNLRAIEYSLPVASAQVKSAILLAGLRAAGETLVQEPGASRDHTERMLRTFGVIVESGPGFAKIAGGQSLQAQHLTIPGDVSAAAFPIVAAALLEGSDITISEVGLNPTRTGFLQVLEEMGAEIEIKEYSIREDAKQSEPVGDIHIRGGQELKGVKIGGNIIPRLLDELPILCIAAALAKGKTEIREAQELRVKESDRISAMAEVLRAFGVEVEELPDGLVIHGGGSLKPAKIDSRGDHRIAMSAAIAGLLAGGAEIRSAESILTSYPRFMEDLQRLGAAMRTEA